MAASEAIEVVAGLGALILLFEVGVESTIGQMLQVGKTALFVAVLGVIAPFALGWGVGAMLLPDASLHVHAFLGATLCATSVGITARVLQDLGASRSPEARIILGAAVIDDVLGLVILGAVSGAITAAAQGETFSIFSLVKITAAATAFLGGSLVIGSVVSRRLFAMASLLQVRGVLVTISLSLCFLLAWAASLMGLAPIIGAFAAGLILEDVHFKDFVSRGERPLDELLRPISDVLVPIFFVMMGLQTDLSAFAMPSALGLAALLTVAAIIGKQICALGVLTPGVNRLAVGIGMIPRGEVGLIFAGVGARLSLDGAPVIAPAVFSAIVVMVAVTTMVTPVALKWSLSRSAGRRPWHDPHASRLPFRDAVTWASTRRDRPYGRCRQPERTMLRTSATVALFVMMGAQTPGSQFAPGYVDPAPILAAAAAEIGEANLRCITFSGTGYGGAVGQTFENAVNVDWPRIDSLANYTRTINWDARTSKETFDRKPGLNPASWKYGAGLAGWHADAEIATRRRTSSTARSHGTSTATGARGRAA